MRGFAPQLCKSPGFQAYCLANGGNGVIFALSVFETEAQAKLSNAMARNFVEKNLRDQIPELPEVVVGRVGLARTYAGIKRQHLRYFDYETFS
jgi:hypothetical protein